MSTDAVSTDALSTDALARRIADVFGQVLGREVRVDQSLFRDLSATSLQVARITARLRRAVDDRVRLEDVFELPVAAGLARALGGAAPPAQPEEETPGDPPLLPGPLWYRTFHPEEPTPFTVDAVLRTTEPIDTATLERALVAVLRRHETLGGSRPEVVPLTGGPTAEVIADLRGRLDAERGDVVRLAHLAHPAHLVGDGDHLLLVVHHLVCDAVSLRIILADLERIYRSGGADTVPRPIGAHTWARLLAAYASSPESEPERAYWQTLAPMPASPLRRVPSGPDTRNDSTDELLAADRAERLRRVAAGLGLTVGEAVLACVALALGERTGAEAVTIGVNHHGRSARFGDRSCAHSVGWFSFSVACRLDLAGPAGPGAPLADAVRSLADQARRIPRHGIGAAIWGLSGDHTDPVAAACRRAAEEVLVTVNSTVDLADAGPAAGRWRRLPLPCPPATVSRSTRAGMSCTPEPDGSFRFRWRWHPGHVDGDGIRWVAGQTGKLLSALSDGS